MGELSILVRESSGQSQKIYTNLDHTFKICPHLPRYTDLEFQPDLGMVSLEDGGL